MSDEGNPEAVTLSAAAATGVGSLPGTDVWESSALVRGELPDFPHLPELPARGPGADMIGRALGLLANVSPDLSAQTSPDGWRFSGAATSTPPKLMRRAQSWLAEDLDAAQGQWAEFDGNFKLQLCGPWTLAASVELPNGARAISDRGASRDLTAALSEACALLVADVRRRLPSARIVLQLDEPALPSVLMGGVRTQSGWGHLPPVEPVVVEQSLTAVIDQATAAGALVGIHCCGARPPLDLFRSAGARLISLDFSLANSDEDAVGAALESRVTVMAGLVNTMSPVATVKQTLEPLVSMLHRLGIPIESAIDQLVITPTCGLAGAGTAEAVRGYYELASTAGAALRNESVGEQHGRPR